MTNTQSTALLVAKSVNTPRIYLACLAAYNNGRLHGAWIDADKGQYHIWNGLRAMLRASPEPGAEEWAIHGATSKSHLLSEAGMPLVEPSRPFLAGACELGNRLVRSLRKRAGSWQPHAGEPSKEKTGMVNESESVLMRRYPSVPRKWLLRVSRSP